MDAHIRTYAPTDEEPIVAFSIRAWAPVFVSLAAVLGSEVFGRLHDDWRQDQEKAVRDVLASPSMHVWVAVADPEPIGFVAATLHEGSLIGEIFMLAVDPDHQGDGVGTALTEVATERLRQSGMRVAMVDKGVAIRAMPQHGGSTKRPITSRCQSPAASRLFRRRAPILRAPLRWQRGRGLSGDRQGARTHAGS